MELIWVVKLVACELSIHKYFNIVDKFTYNISHSCFDFFFVSSWSFHNSLISSITLSGMECLIKTCVGIWE